MAEEFYVLQSHGLTLQAANRPPFQLLVYHLPPPPPGFLYAFTCGPTSFMQPPAIAPFTDRSLASYPHPSPPALVSLSTNKLDELHSAANTCLIQHQFGHRCASDAAEPPLACTPFWSTKGKGFPRPDHKSSIETKDYAQQKQNNSASTSQTMTPDEAIQQNKRFVTTPSFRVKKFVRTNSRNNCVPDATEKLESVAASSGYQSPMPAEKLVHYSPRTSKVQHRITEYWRVCAKPKEFQRQQSTSDTKLSSGVEEVYNHNDTHDLNKLMGNFSFGLS